MIFKIYLITLLTCSVLIPINALAHHGNASHFDVSQTVEVSGKITRFVFTNPHVYVYFNVEIEEGESQEWRCESTSATALRRVGWNKDTLTKDQNIKVLGNPGRREEYLCFAKQLFIDGVEYSVNQAPPNNNEFVPTELNSMAVANRSALHGTGQPNISGYWINPYFGPNRLAPYPPEGGYVRSEVGQIAADNFDDRYESPALFCKPHNIIRAWGQDAHVNEVRQTQNAVYITNGYMDFERVVHLDQTEHPDAIEPSTAGHSIGWWKDDTLVVDTTGFTAGSIFPRNDVMHSDQMHIIERFRYNPESQQLERRYSVEDPLYLAEVRQDIDYQNISAEPYEPYGCEHHGGASHIRPEEQ